MSSFVNLFHEKHFLIQISVYYYLIDMEYLYILILLGFFLAIDIVVSMKNTSFFPVHYNMEWREIKDLFYY